MKPVCGGSSDIAAYRFDGFVLDLMRGALLTTAGEEISLRPQSFQLLRLFVQNAGRLLDRGAINQVVWPDIAVSDDSITQCIRDIRRAIGDDEQRVLKTVRRRGYLFTTEVTTVRDRSSGMAPEALFVPAKPSIAVLPFANWSGDPAQEYFSDGITEDIITELSRNRSLFVIARNSSFAYRRRIVDVRQIARELGVRYILEGSVRRDATRIRVTAQLIDAELGAHIWAERYDRDQQGIFAIQDEVTTAVATAIGPVVADAEMHSAMRRPPQSLGAWDLYQQGLWQFTRLDPAANDAARALFSRATDRDPLFAAAYTGISRTYNRAAFQYQTVPFREGIRLATEYAYQATRLDPGDANALTELAATLFLQGETDRMLPLLRQALDINPNCASAHLRMGTLLIFTGRSDEGRQAMAGFARLSPRDTSIALSQGQIAISYYFEQQYERCVNIARQQLSTQPDYTLTHRWLAAALGQLGRTEEARALSLRARQSGACCRFCSEGGGKSRSRSQVGPSAAGERLASDSRLPVRLQGVILLSHQSLVPRYRPTPAAFGWPLAQEEATDFGRLGSSDWVTHFGLSVIC